MEIAMPLIQVSIIEGRPAALRSELLQGIAKVTSETLGVPVGTVRVLLTEIPAEHWTVGGVPVGQPAPQGGQTS
jgi:4-oxalocrotonate tautomerase